MIVKREKVMKRMRRTADYYDVTETESEWLLGMNSPKVTREREAMCVTEAVGESRRVSTLLS